MLGIGFFEILIIALVCFIAIGPKQLPSVMRTIAHFYRHFISLRDEFRFQIMSADDGAEHAATTKPTVKSEKPADEIIVIPRDQGHG